VADLLFRLGIPSNRVKIVMRNGVHSQLGSPLADGDRLALFPAVGGG
jgi:molybdopterin converting factor small subunit